MSAGPPYSKNAVTRAGKHLAANLRAVRAGERTQVVDVAAEADVAARDAVRWWLSEHVQAMLAVRDVVTFTIAVTLEDEPWPRVTSRSKRADTVIDKLTRHPGALAGMVDLGGVRLVARTQEDVDELVGELVHALDVRKVVIMPATSRPRATAPSISTPGTRAATSRCRRGPRRSTGGRTRWSRRRSRAGSTTRLARGARMCWRSSASWPRPTRCGTDFRRRNHSCARRWTPRVRI
ncbi:MAG TPA: hypothetical protein VN238_15985 [Solirubrobacteraceae bacterium]|nr:hypothetical protein [Solirubrobacteraceae bacterium]